MIPAVPTQVNENMLSATLLKYRLYGLNVESRFQFSHHIMTGGCGTTDLIFECVNAPPVAQAWQTTDPIFPTTDDPDLGLYYYRQNDFEVLRLPGTGDFYIWPDKIICHLEQTSDLTWLEIQFLGSVFSFWLERQGILALHASAVVLAEDCAVGFLATSKGGKSSLAAAMVQSGCLLLTDDILPLDYQSDNVLGRPGYAQMRLWPDQAEHFLGNYQDLVPVYSEITKRRVPIGPDGWGQFCDVPQQIGCLYLPERRDPATWGTATVIESVSPRDAIIELVRQSFAGPILHAMGILPQRFNTLSKLVQQVPVRRLIYPNGVDYLPQVCEAIRADFSKEFSV